MKISETSLDKLKTFVSFTDVLFEADKPFAELTPELAEQLYNRVVNNHFRNVDDFLNYKAYNDACGCLGPRDGELYCGCSMRSLLEIYKFHIAVMIKERFDFRSYEYNDPRNKPREPVVVSKVFTHLFE